MSLYLPSVQLPVSLHGALSSLNVLPEFNCPVAQVVVAVDIMPSPSGERCELTLQLPSLLKQNETLIKGNILKALGASFSAVEVDIQWLNTQPAQAQKSEAIVGVKQIIAVASGKGGVGKSTTAVNLAVALHKLGAEVGLLDADIYGPSQALMLGIADERPEMLPGKRMKAIRSPHGVSAIGMGNLVSDNTPMAWRGPMATGALQQMLRQTDWPLLDYLVVDMPPGTGDIQLTLAQSVPVNGSVIVTTPQDIALLDAKKGIELFRKVKIDVLGVVENMAIHTCSNCGHEEAIFGEDGGNALAQAYDTQVIGRLPLKMAIRQHADSGCPSVAKDSYSNESQAYFNLAKRVALQLFVNQQQREATGSGSAAPFLTQSDD